MQKNLEFKVDARELMFLIIVLYHLDNYLLILKPLILSVRKSQLKMSKKKRKIRKN